MLPVADESQSTGSGPFGGWRRSDGAGEHKTIMRTAAHEPEPEDEGRLHDRIWTQIANAGGDENLPGPVRLIGQERAIRGLEVLFRLYLADRESSDSKSRRRGAIAVCGPAGCGKEAAVRQVAGDFDLPVATLDLYGAEGMSPDRLAVAALRRSAGDDLSEFDGAAIYVDGFDGATVETKRALTRLLRDPGRVEYAFEGEKIGVDLEQVLWFVGLPTVPVEIGGQTGIQAVCEISQTLAANLQGCVVFRELGPSDLYEILSLSEFSPLIPVIERYRRHTGCELQVGEMGMWQIVHDARQRFADLGVRGLALAVNRFEEELWTP